MLNVNDHLRVVMSLSDERDTWERRIEAAWREGHAAALDDVVVRSLAGAWPEPGHLSPLEVARWGPGGRAHFGDPRPGDFPGRGVPA